jgi:hypothetical protein
LTQDPRRDLSVPLPVKVERRDGAARHEYAVNVSASGLCLHAQAPLPIGEEVRVTFRLPSDPREIRAVCKVVWASRARDRHPLPRCYETGLYLVEIAEADAERLAFFVSAQVDRR